MITDVGRDVAAKATAELNAARFGLDSLPEPALTSLFAVLRDLRVDAGDFAGD